MKQSAPWLIRGLLLGLIAAAWSLAVAPLNAALLPLNPPGPSESDTDPDITTFGVNTSYDGLGHFVADGSLGVNLFNDDATGGTQNLQISLYINPITGQPISGTFEIDGTYPRLGANSGILLTGSISKFGFLDAPTASTSDGDEQFDFLFHTTGGDLASRYPQIGVVLSNVDANFNGTWGTNSFSDTSFSGQTDSFSVAVPEPASLTLIGAAGGCLLGLSILRRRMLGSKLPA